MPNLRAATSGCLINVQRVSVLIVNYYAMTINWLNTYHPPVNACHGYSRRSIVKSRKYAWNNCFLLSQNSIWKSPWKVPGWFSSVASTSWSMPYNIDCDCYSNFFFPFWFLIRQFSIQNQNNLVDKVKDNLI